MESGLAQYLEDVSRDDVPRLEVTGTAGAARILKTEEQEGRR
jgi:hypothetical protein